MAKNLNFKITALDKTRAAFQSVENRLGGVGRKMGSLKGIIAGAFAVAGVAAIGKFVSSIIDAGDNLQKVSIRLGASTEALSQMRHVVDIGGTSFEAYTKALTRLQKNTSDAANGLATPRRAFEALGIEVEKFKALKPQVQFEILADALKGVSNPADRTRIAMDLMGRSGSEMLSVMADGSEGIRKLRGEADALGKTLTRAQADSMAKFNDAMARTGNAIDGVGQSIVVALGPTLTALAEWFSEKIPRAVEWTKMAFGRMQNAARVISIKILNSLAALAEKLAALPDLLGGEKFKAWAESLRQSAREVQTLREKTSAATGAVGSFDDSVKKSAGTLRDVYNPKLREAAEATGKATKKTKEFERAAARVFEATRTPLEKYQQKLKELNDLQSKGLINSDTYARAAAQAQDELARQTKAAAGKVKAANKDAWKSSGDALKDFLRQGRYELQDFSRLAVNLLADIIRQQMDVSKGLGSLGGGGRSGGGGFGGILTAGLKLFGFAGGGDFKVGAGFPSIPAGRDNRLVSFAARDGEQVSVRTPEQVRAETRGAPAAPAGVGEVNVNFSITTLDARGVRQVLQESRATIVQIINRAMTETGKPGIV
jgi:hypothetical protein